MRIIYLYLIICFCWISCGNILQAQQLSKVTETDRFVEYYFTNDSLKVVHSYEFLIDSDMGELYQVTAQQVESRQVDRPEQLIEAFALSDNSTPLFDIVNEGSFRGENKANLRFHAVRYEQSNPEEMTFVREARFRVYKDTERTGSQPSLLRQNEASVLATGEWYKIPIAEKGIYRLNAEYLEELGVEISQIDPENIQLWGTPGGELPRANSADRPQLTQIPILVEGESDNSFDEGDRIIFYADSPHRVNRNTADGTFSHQLNRYTNNNYVMLRISPEGESLRLSPQTGPGGPIVTQFRDFLWKEEDLVKSESLIRSGLNWLGVQLSNSSGQQNKNILDETIPGLLPNQQAETDIRVVGRSTGSISMSFSYNDQNLGTQTFPSISNYNDSDGISGHARTFSSSLSIQNQENIQLSAQLNAPDSNSEGFIDWISIYFDRELVADDNYLFIYSPESVHNQSATYQMRGFSGAPYVMEVSNPVSPVQLEVSANSGSYEFSYSHQTDNRFIAQSELFDPEPGEPVSNQNLRGINSYPDYVIVTSESFLDHANEWADYRQQKDGFETVVVTQNQIFNEFSGATPDVTAIRDYIKYLYDHALNSGQNPLQHLLLFGDTTYDYRNILEGSIQNHVFTFQSEESLNRRYSYGSDDYFAFLDDDEGEWSPTDSSERIDIGVGRFPVNTIAEAETVMKKTKEYESSSTKGDWRTRFSFASDDDYPSEEHNRDLHLLNADGTAQVIDKTETATRIEKIHMLSYPAETSAAGRRIPEATDDFINAFNKGSLVVNYSGHGGQFVLADEQLFSEDMIPRFNNSDKPAIFVTATCQFGRYDDTDSNSGAEQTLLWNQGGAVAAYTTTRIVVTSSSIGSNNFGLNIQLTRQMISREQNGKPQRLGDIYMNTKNTSHGSGSNARKFILLGDPAVRIGLPEHESTITKINDVDLEANPDSIIQIRALDQMKIEGMVTDRQGNPMTSYQGETSITVFDSERIVNLPDRTWVQEGRCYMSNCQYSVENDVLFNGRVSVKNGMFSAEFIVPRDITFSEEPGRILTYSKENGNDGSGSSKNVLFNGVNPDAQEDADGPEMDVYLNDPGFVNGNLVGSSSTLIVELEDESGINTTGKGVGHEIIATIDTNPKRTIVLNEFYQSDLDDYREGRIEYPLDELSQGSYTLTVRAWDVYNNAEETSIYFEVSDSEQLEIRNVHNYPNPMNNKTRFVFEHNQPGNLLDINIRIYTLSGMPVTQIEESQITTNSYANIEWNGLDRDYDRLANGTYIYVLRVGTDTPEGKQTEEKIEKLVIIR